MMTIQWTFIATFLYVEIGVVILLLLPFISPTRWQRIFKSRLLKNIGSYSNIYFNVLIAVLTILLFDAIRDVRRYSVEPDPHELAHAPHAETVVHMKLFRAQRNFYIAGFALFLWLVIKRLVVLIANNATLAAQSEASLKQATSASEMAKKLIEEKDNKDNKEKEDTCKKSAMAAVADQAKANNDLKKELDETRLELEKSKEELFHSNLDLETLRKQAESTNKEYDRLVDEHYKLEKKVAILSGEDDGSKKDD
ncbi:B-cell receptor-associated protein 31-like isoform X2 [Lineus longissimus]|uniref:B-cell receptor-associated protein 31-like isoform X2 n=1 Tax=Lineus longissimus TaxID=88925 RepID=UPI002B4D1ADF